MNANRALGLLAALLVTAGQAMVFAVDTSAAVHSTAEPTRYRSVSGGSYIAEGQLAYGVSRGLTGG